MSEQAIAPTDPALPVDLPPADEPDEVLAGLSAIASAIEESCDSNELMNIAVCTSQNSCGWNGPHWRLSVAVNNEKRCPLCGAKVLSAWEIREMEEAQAERESQAVPSP